MRSLKPRMLSWSEVGHNSPWPLICNIYVYYTSTKRDHFRAKRIINYLIWCSKSSKQVLNFPKKNLLFFWDFVWKLSKILIANFSHFVRKFFQRFWKFRRTFLSFKNFLGNIKISVSLKYQTFLNIAAHLVTQTIIWQVLGNISNFYRNLSLFFLDFYIFQNVSIDY